jgi:hypothetical protein
MWRPRRWYSRQRLAAMLYCDGLQQKEVALVLGVTPSQIHDDLRLIRRLYESRGRPVRGRIQFRIRLVEDGYLSERP